MIDFWLGTCEIHRPSAENLWGLPGNPNKMAIEVMHDGNAWAVLLSSVDDVHDPRDLSCLLGFTNAANPCNVWHDRGFPLLDAIIEFDKATGALKITSPCFHEAPVMEYERMLLALSGIQFGASASVTVSATTLVTRYTQSLQSPDALQPGLLLQQRTVTWQPARSNVTQLLPIGNALNLDVNLGPKPPRSPCLEPLTTSVVTLAGAWVGTITLPSQAKLGPICAPEKLSDTAIGIPSYRFDDVEAIGFRVDLGGLEQDVTSDMAALIAPLNFHLNQPTDPGAAVPLPDFHYEVAAPMLLIELLRYGRMKSTDPRPPLTVNDAQGQHELVVRLLVGRVDEDTAQAQMPAAYAPAIFVDNTWSKTLGRDLLGYDKCLADFCVERSNGLVRLLPDGRLAEQTAAIDSDPVPLEDVRRIAVVDTTNPTPGPTLFEIDYSADGSAADSSTSLNLGSAILSTLGAIRWKLSDFNAAQFSGAFARQAISDSVMAFTCVQTTPVVNRELERTWVTTRFVVDSDISVSFPTDIATLTLHAVPIDSSSEPSSGPAMWNRLCQMLGDGRTAQLRLGAGSRYRIRCSMKLTIDDSLSSDDSTV